jgi:hypothetical protein
LPLPGYCKPCKESIMPVRPLFSFVLDLQERLRKRNGETMDYIIRFHEGMCRHSEGWFSISPIPEKHSTNIRALFSLHTLFRIPFSSWLLSYWMKFMLESY